MGYDRKPEASALDSFGEGTARQNYWMWWAFAVCLMFTGVEHFLVLRIEGVGAHDNAAEISAVGHVFGLLVLCVGCIFWKICLPALRPAFLISLGALFVVPQVDLMVYLVSGQSARGLGGGGVINVIMTCVTVGCALALTYVTWRNIRGWASKPRPSVAAILGGKIGSIIGGLD